MQKLSVEIFGEILSKLFYGRCNGGEGQAT
jgi:hypothetical protein